MPSFVGRGARFQIWNPGDHKSYAAEARERAKGRTMRLLPPKDAINEAGLHSNAHEARHTLMLDEVLSALSLRDGGAYVDGTFGLGGYTRAILDGADTTVWAIDRDPEAIERGATLMEEYDPRLTLLQGRFGEMAELLQQAGIEKVDGVVLDLGVSSPQIDDAGRGFSFRFDGPLDMRMEKAGLSAADIVNSMDEGELARLIKELGEERHARASPRHRRAGMRRRSRELPSLPISCAAPCRRGVLRLIRQPEPSWRCVCM